MRRVRRLSFVGFTLIGLATHGVGAADLPQYRLEVGQQLEYRSSSTFRSETASSRYKDERTAWVVRKNGDGGWRLLVRTTSTSSHDGKSWRDPNLSLAYFDLAPDGTIIPNESFGGTFDPTTFLPRLPTVTSQVERGWEAVRTGWMQPFVDGTSHFQVITAGKANEAWVFDEVRETPLNKIYATAGKTRFTFDPHQGTISRVEDKFTQGYGAIGECSSTIELTAIERRDVSWIAGLDAESDRFFAASRAYDALSVRAESETIDEKTMTADGVGRVLSRLVRKQIKVVDVSGSPLLDEARAVLTKARDAATLPEIRELLEARIKIHDRTVKHTREDAIRRARVVGKPAAEWETKDLTGKTHRLNDYRGRVVVLDFWYRGCGWCMRGMPEINQLAEDFKGLPVAVLGMSTDQEEDDAKFVAKEMGLSYPVLKARDLTENYSVKGFPTLILIGPDGTVRNLHVGYSTTLREEVAREIRGLMPAK